MQLLDNQPVNINKEVAILARQQKRFQNTEYHHVTTTGFQSSFFDPYTHAENYYGNLKTADRLLNRDIDCWTLRRVSKKAWIINVCIKHIQDTIKPYLKPTTNRNYRGFVIHKVGEDVIKADGKKSQERTEIEKFLMNTGTEKDSERDNFQRFCLKILRDSLEIDQVATEIGYTRAGKPYAFWAVDGATIEKVLPEQPNPNNIKFVQLIENIPQAFYPEGTLVFDYQNPRSDVRFSFYGYSYVEQAIDLVTSTINAFTYNAGFFTENKLPKGMLLLDGNASQESVEQMEDYICDIMSGGTQNQWRVPIIPSGNGSGENTSIKWVSLAGTNREMEFQGWLDFLTSGIVSLFGCSMEELGLHSSKSQPMFEHNSTPEIEASKSIILGNTLNFLQQYINQILEKFYPNYEFEFVGYERDDPKALLDIAKGEMETYKTTNEIRKEKGLPPLEADWADKCPANPQLVQLYQSAQAQEQGSGMEDTEGMEEDEGGDFGSVDDNAEGDNADSEDNTDNEAWQSVESATEENPTTEESSVTEKEETTKSLNDVITYVL